MLTFVGIVVSTDVPSTVHLVSVYIISLKSSAVLGMGEVCQFAVPILKHVQKKKGDMLVFAKHIFTPDCYNQVRLKILEDNNMKGTLMLEPGQFQLFKPQEGQRPWRQTVSQPQPPSDTEKLLTSCLWHE